MAKTKTQDNEQEYLEAIRDMNEPSLNSKITSLDNPTSVKAEILNNDDKPSQVNGVVVKIDREGVIAFSNQQELGNAARLLIQMKLAPEHLRKEGVEIVMSALTICKQYRLPISAMNEMMAVRGKVGVFGTLVTALCQRHPDYGELKVQYVTADQDVICLKNKNLNAKVWAAVISVRKKGQDEWNEYFFTEDEAKTAGLLSNGVYTKYLKDMLFHKAKWRAMNTEYASALKGLESAENMQYEKMAEKESPVDRMNKRLGLTAEALNDDQ